MTSPVWLVCRTVSNVVDLKQRPEDIAGMCDLNQECIEAD